MMSLRRREYESAMTGAGRAMLSTTWLMTSALVELTPSQTTTNAGIMVTSRRTMIGNAEADEALHDHLAGHRADRRARQSGRQQRGQKHARRGGAEQRRQRLIGGLDLGDVAVAGVEGARRHDHHRHIDEAGDPEGDEDLDVGEPHQEPPLAVVARRRPVLGEPGMQEDRVRHDRRADDADRERQRAGVGQVAEPRCRSPAARQSIGAMNISTR